MRVELLEELLQRFRGLVGLHAGGGEERPGASAHVERELGAVGVAVLLAQVLFRRDVNDPPRIVLSTRSAK